MKKLLLILFIFLTTLGHSQSFFERDTTLNVKRTAWSSGLIAGGWIASTVALQNIWYKEHWSEFHLFDDSREWLGMDKIGHAYTTHAITKNITEIYHWAGLKRGTSLAIGSGVALGYLTTIEILDGFSKDWGFSWSDMAANSLGVAMFAWQDLLWQEQRFKLKFSTHLSPYAQTRPNVLGSTIPERLLKDYNGQTYWLTVSPGMFLKEDTKFPKWLGFSFGYSVDQKVHGDYNEMLVYRADGSSVQLSARSQYLFSLDIDLEQIPTNKKWLKAIFKAFNHLKVPFPAMILSDGKLGGHYFYF